MGSKNDRCHRCTDFRNHLIELWNYSNGRSCMGCRMGLRCTTFHSSVITAVRYEKDRKGIRTYPDYIPDRLGRYRLRRASCLCGAPQIYSGTCRTCGRIYRNLYRRHGKLCRSWSSIRCIWRHDICCNGCR